MSGHSKWSTIKRKKGAIDAKRGKIFTKIIKEITLAARLGGGDPEGNPRLRQAIMAAKDENMPKENIERAIKKGIGGDEGAAAFEEVTYEGYGPGGVAVLVEVMTDNRNRTVAEIRHIFSKHGGNLGENGCVSWMFEKKGTILVDKKAVSEDELMELALEAGADDVRDEENEYEVITSPAAFEAVRKAIESRGLPVVSARIGMVPQTTVRIGEDKAAQMLKMMEKFEDNDDVQNVYANFDIPDEIMEKLS
ncbi:MAG TPA: YebC/PmpR family DNA-binding transcriptional regulator [Syntrophales bacterium]|nr:YebC/PmpR family DNA-binding transcriptional regulator [Syntrophales bacterium]HOM07944.1 YebC/PmpR family DNA-binding transcriptional regulator [Syntrophales bacterium]HOO00658.1 YebC/PmpR family DNA-binding transcriptional regulator [Syntrophales bacterium]HPC01912.1 YebC/PmpR family DNA-binding transcriptional regulator [Syntrophales bacterium]HRS87808.1 YebC/PmpR family DNA-binding transcriptional regulator [Syntrophales bacterium]